MHMYVHVYVSPSFHSDRLLLFLLIFWPEGGGGRGLGRLFVASGASYSERSEPKRTKRARARGSERSCT